MKPQPRTVLLVLLTVFPGMAGAAQQSATSKAASTVPSAEQSGASKAASTVSDAEQSQAPAPSTEEKSRVSKDNAVQKTDYKVDSKASRPQGMYDQLTKRDYMQAVSSYQMEIDRAQQSGDRKSEAAASMKKAQALEYFSAADPNLTSQATAAYRQTVSAASAAGDNAQRSLAVNNLAVLLLKQGQTAEAAQLVTSIDLSTISDKQRPVFQFNIARTLESNGKGREAYPGYVQAFSGNHTLVQALIGAFRTAGQQERPADEVVKLGALALNNGLPDVGHDQILHFLVSTDDQNATTRVLAALLETYAAQELSPDLFRTRELPLLQTVAEKHKSLSTAIGQIQTAYLGNLPFDPRAAEPVFSSWRSGQEAKSMSVALEHVAAVYAAQAQPEMALGRYGAGWEIAHDPNCAVEYSSLLSRYPALDPGEKLVNQLVREIFEEKGQMYLIGDWAHILPLHIALGTIFEDRKIWGNFGDPRGALFQWQHAIQADGELRKRQPSLPPSPGLHAHLGNVWRAIGRSSDAVKEFLAAGEGFVQAGDKEQARKSAEAIKQMMPGGLPGSFAVEDRSRWQQLVRETGVS